MGRARTRPAGLLLPPAPEVLAGSPTTTFTARRRAQTSRTLRRVAAGRRTPRGGRVAAAQPGRGLLASVRASARGRSAEVASVALGDPDAVSVGDYHLPSLVTWALAGERRGDDHRMLELLAPWPGQRGRRDPPARSRPRRPPRRGPRLPVSGLAYR